MNKFTVEEAEIYPRLWGVFNFNKAGCAFLVKKEHADRVCNMLNDTQLIGIYDSIDFTKAEDTLRVAATLETFRLQENLEWEDLNPNPNSIEIIKSFVARLNELKNLKE
jgi:hypothetical protein